MTRLALPLNDLRACLRERQAIRSAQIINKSSGDGLFTEEDARLVTLWPLLLALANSEMTASIVEANKIKRDLKLAAVVQTGLFPRENHRYACGLNVPMQAFRAICSIL